MTYVLNTYGFWKLRYMYLQRLFLRKLMSSAWRPCWMLVAGSFAGMSIWKMMTASCVSSVRTWRPVRWSHCWRLKVMFAGSWNTCPQRCLPITAVRWGCFSSFWAGCASSRLRPAACGARPSCSVSARDLRPSFKLVWVMPYRMHSLLQRLFWQPRIAGETSRKGFKNKNLILVCINLV